MDVTGRELAGTRLRYAPSPAATSATAIADYVLEHRVPDV